MHATVLTLALLLAWAPSGGELRSDRDAVPDSVRAAVDRVFAEYDGVHVPGCAVGVSRGDSLVLARGYGMADLDHALAIRPNTVFRIGSVSKQFTAAAMVLLEQDGILSLDDPVRRWIPELPELAPGFTLRALLHHTSGARDYLVLMTLAGKRNEDWYSDDDVVAMLARQTALNFAPGSEWLYSNSGYFLLSRVVKRATGRTLAEYARVRMFQPLGMTSTHFHDDPTVIVPNRALGYAPAQERPEGYRISDTTLPMIGDGGIYTSIEDMARWDRNLRDPVVGGAAFVDAMLRRGMLTSGDTLEYALGLSHGRYRGLRTVGHGGAFVGYRADHTRFPEEDLAVFTLCNRADANPSRLSRQVAEAFLGDRMEPAPERSAGRGGDADSVAPEWSPRALEPYAGTYRAAELEASYRIRVDGDTLRLLVGNGLDGPLVPVEPEVFRRGPLTLRFEREGDGRVSAFLVDAGRVRGIRFQRRSES